MNETIYRVVCPDSQQAGANQWDTLEEAIEFALRCDQMHDQASCGYAEHTIQVAEWTPVEVSA